MRHLKEFEDFGEGEDNPKVKGTNMTLSQLEDEFGRIRSYTLKDGEIDALADLDYPHLMMPVKDFLEKFRDSEEDGEEEDDEEDLGNLYADEEWDEDEGV
jgi:hypothetical protein